MFYYCPSILRVGHSPLFLSKSVRSVVLSASQTTSFHTTPDKIIKISASVQCVFVITRSNTHFCNTRLRRVYKLFHKKILKTQNFLIFCGLLRGTRGDVQIIIVLRKTKSGVRNATKCMFFTKNVDENVLILVENDVFGI